MDSKKGKKLSKATVATVLAASGVIVAMPQQTSAYSFSDLNPFADYYEPILDLASRKIATGYSDGTFKPNQAITREDAAKMLALTIDVNITNPKNPGFKDVQMSNPNYRYIAALAEAGVINGYSDKTFKPKELITRGQMAKILTLGFKFGVSSKLNHGFKDVNAKNANAYFIQTLYDLNVTKGKTPVSFDPFNTVTRAQMATFIWRAEKADRGNPVYAIGDITGNQIYINGVAHTIAPHLRSILNAANKNVLQGAFIEGNFSGNTVQNITKLTINASGNSSRLLALDGGYSSFAGELIIHGSYVRFKNINFTGRVEVAEAPRRSLASLSNTRIASVGNVASFIDWGKPTDPKNEDFLNPVDKETLQEKPDPTKPPHLQKYTDRMSNLKKYVDFENADIRHLYVTSDRTFVQANYEIDRLTLQGNVANVELYASPKAMYIDTDYNVSVFGVHDIQYVYKNTLKNVSFKTDSTYDYYYITSSNGFTDIGTHAYITNAIIPPNKTVNDVFDDYKTDDPNIGYVKDENGKAVDRDPVENTIIPDVTGPRITQLDVAAGGSTAEVTLTADEDGTYYYVVKPAKEKAPTINEIKTGGTKYNGNGPLVMDEPVKFTVSGLETMTDYVIYVIVIDKMDNVSEKEEQEFSTIDNRPPTMTVTPGEKKPGGKRFEFVVKNIREAGEIFYLVRQEKEIDKNITVDDVIKNKTGSRKVTQPGDQTFEVREYGTPPRLNPVQPSTDYVVYAVMVDLSGNKMRIVESAKIKTEAPDIIQPYVVGDGDGNPLLRLVNEEKGIFEFLVSEPLDPTTAKDLKNYTLSGTAILNITGQKTINPSKVELSGDGKKVQLTIPALNALVKGDTIRATVSKNVLDLSENEFEHIDRFPANQNSPRNEAYYTHKDDIEPEIKINKVIVERDRNLVEFEATKKAGTYYYMILESGYDFDSLGIKPRDFVEEFELKNINATTKFGESGSKIYTGNLLNQYGPAELGVNTKSVNIEFDKLNPFKSYSVYMVLKDRAGLVSNTIISAPIVADSKAPLISGLTARPQSGVDNGINFSFTADEDGKMHVIPIKKYIYDSRTQTYQINTEFFEKNSSGEYVLKQIPNIFPTSSSDTQREAFGKVASRAGGTKSVDFYRGLNENRNITNLEKHQEYGFYIAVEDKVGTKTNFSIFERKDTTDPAAPNEPNGEQMIRYAYTDGKAPEIIDRQIIYREGERGSDAIFRITFSEAILRQTGVADPNKFNKSVDLKANLALGDLLSLSGRGTTTAFNANSFEIEKYIYNENDTTKPSYLYLKPKPATLPNVINQSFSVELNSDSAIVYDYDNKNVNMLEARKGFITNKIARYVYTSNIVNTILAAKIANPTNVTPTLKRGKTVEVAMELGSPLELEPRFYYVVMQTNASNTPTADDIIDIVDNGKSITNMAFYGKGSIDTSLPSMGTNRVIKLEASGNNEFFSNQKVYLISIDKYGNIIWAKDSLGSISNSIQ